MKIDFELSHEDKQEIAAMTAAILQESGVSFAGPERTRPFSVPEAADELGISEHGVRRMVAAGIIQKASLGGRCLIPVSEIRKAQNVS